jgi:cation diffusion facilitator family transporter
MPENESKTVVVAAIAANAAIAVTKFVAAAISGSSAMVAEGIHSLVDTGDGILIWNGIRRSQRGPDPQHPFGHGQELYFWVVVVAVLVFAVGGGMSAYEGITHLLHPQPIADAFWNYVVLAVAALFEGGSWLVARRRFQHERRGRGFIETIETSKDPTSYAILLEDSAALAGILVAAGGVGLSHALDSPIPDGVASLLIAALLMAVAWLLASAARRLVTGVSADPALVDAIRRSAEADPAVAGVAKIVTVHFGPDSILANLAVHFRDDLTVEDLPRAIDRVQQRVRETEASVRHVFVDAEPLARAGSG